jgi:hypothetical protein
LNLNKGELGPTLGSNGGELSSNRFGLNLKKDELGSNLFELCLTKAN